MSIQHLKCRLLPALGAALLCTCLLSQPPQARADDLSTASALSALPVAMSVMSTATVLSAGAVLTVVSVQVVADGVIWTLARASDGARLVVKSSAMSAGMASATAGMAVTVTAISAGWLLCAGSEVLALVPNALGQSLLHDERVFH